MNKSEKLFCKFVRCEHGGGTITSLFIVIVLAMLLGISLDATNGWRNRAYLTSVADMGAHAGAVAIAEGKTEAEILAEVRRVVETNLPTNIWGNTISTATDVALMEYDIETSSYVTGGTKDNAVVVALQRSASRGNPVNTLLMQFSGVASMDVFAISAGIFEVSNICGATDGFFAKGQVRLASQADVGGGICVHSQDRVWLPQQNTFQPGSYVSMPDLALCEDKCQDSENPGINPLEANMIMPDFGEYIRNAYTDFEGPVAASATKTKFFTDDPSDPHDAAITLGNTAPLVAHGILTADEAGDLSMGAVVDLTHSEFHSLNELPSGLVYRVDCPDSGNGPTTRLTFDGSTGRMEDAVLLSDCNLIFDDGSRVVGSVIITKRITTSTVLSAGQNTEIGDPTASCLSEDRTIIMTLGPVSVPSEFIMSNVTLIVDNNVDIASGTSTNPPSVGFAIYATGAIDVASQQVFRACNSDGDYLTPVARVLRLVLPPSAQLVSASP